jgi:hypothetical protein
VAVAEVPETCFVETPGGRIAYQVVGNGPIDVLVAHSALFPVDLLWDEPSLVRFVDRLSSFCRHVWFDPRGRGASDPLPHVEERFTDAIVDDMLALVDHLGWERVALVGDAPPPILFARGPSPALEAAVDEWLAQPGFEAVGAIASGVDPDVALRAALRRINAMQWGAARGIRWLFCACGPHPLFACPLPRPLKQA